MGRCDLLLETYAYLPFEQRVYTTYQFLRETLQYVAEQATALCTLIQHSTLPPREIAVRYELHADPEPVQILTREPRVLEGQPAIVQLPHRCRFVGSEVVARPFAYLVPPRVAALLRGHGLTVRELCQATGAHLQSATIEGIDAAGSRGILESSLGEQLLRVSWRDETRRLPTGSLLVETEQPLGAIAAYLCEPASDDGLLAVGLLENPTPGAAFPVQRVTARS